MTIRTKRIYNSPEPSDGYRALVDRLWPRGISKSKAAVASWEKDLAPTSELRKWYGHEPEKWAEFRKKYRSELAENKRIDAFIEKISAEKTVTLVFSAKDAERSQAVVLKEFLEEKMKNASGKP